LDIIPIISPLSELLFLIALPVLLNYPSISLSINYIKALLALYSLNGEFFLLASFIIEVVLFRLIIPLPYLFLNPLGFIIMDACLFTMLDCF
jgi:hypothetical protein